LFLNSLCSFGKENSMSNAKLNTCAIVFVTARIEQTAQYYHDVLGFRVVEHYGRAEKFAALYRDAVEIVLVQAAFGTVQSNQARHGAGYDAYLVPDSIDAVHAFRNEIAAHGAIIVQPPALTSYGSIEFVFEDCDGRHIGVGLIRDVATFFESNT
jgi:catechol 2,3-dioxygenase-like lactoylglutathione lyase family enzyme